MEAIKIKCRGCRSYEGVNKLIRSSQWLRIGAVQMPISFRLQVIQSCCCSRGRGEGRPGGDRRRDEWNGGVATQRRWRRGRRRGWNRRTSTRRHPRRLQGRGRIRDESLRRQPRLRSVRQRRYVRSLVAPRNRVRLGTAANASNESASGERNGTARGSLGSLGVRGALKIPTR